MTAFSVFKAISNNSQGKGLDLRHSLFLRVAVDHYSGEIRYLGDPAPINFLLKFNAVGDHL